MQHLRRILLFQSVALAGGLVTTPALPAAELHSGAAGLEIQGVRCANLSEGLLVQSSTPSTEWECVNLGLVVEIGDRIAVSVRGRVPDGTSALSGADSVAPLLETTQIFDEGGIGYAAADFDLDENQDILMTRGFQWLEYVPGNPPAFVGHELEPPGVDVNATDVQDVDFNGDGRPDVAATFFFRTSIEWHENLGGDPPAFLPRTLYRESGWRPWRIEVGDLDGDGDQDLVSWRDELGDVPSVRHRLAWHENEVTGFTVHELYESESPVLAQIDSVVADLDADGDADVAASDCASGRTLWFENDGSSDPVFQLHVIDEDFAGATLDASDLDQDGDLDLMTGMFGDRQRLYENLGGKPLGFAVHELVSASQGPLLGDLNGDGRADIVMSPNEYLGLRWFENQGGFVFALHDVRGDERVIGDGVLVDLGEDGNLDLVTTNSGGAGQTIRVEAKLTVGAWVRGATLDAAQCLNLSTGQRVQTPAPVDGVVDCKGMGLSVSPGDTVQISVRGIAD